MTRPGAAEPLYGNPDAFAVADAAFAGAVCGVGEWVRVEHYGSLV